MQRVETQRSELRELSDLGFARIDARFGQARAEIDARFAEGRAQSDIRLIELREEMHVGFANLEKRLVSQLEQRFSDLIKWSFVFWVGSTVTLVVALAALGRFVR